MFNDHLIPNPVYVSHLVNIHYGLAGELSPLPGEVDYNFHLSTSIGEYTVKISRPDTNRIHLDFQVAMLRYLVENKFPIHIPEMIASESGDYLIDLGNRQFLRLQKWVPGTLVRDIQPRSPGLLQSWGRCCGLFSRFLEKFDHPGAHIVHRWNPTLCLDARQYRSYFVNPEQTEIADYFWSLFEEEVLPLLPKLRKSVNYHDAHEMNLLVGQDLFRPKITGVIDFGDALYTETVNELAVACAYAAMGSADPLQTIAEVVKAYHAEFPLLEYEMQVLFPLINARLLLSVAHAAWNKHQEPDNTYLQVSEKPAWDLLQTFRKLSPSFAHYRIREACGLEPCPRASILRQDNPRFQLPVKSRETRMAPIDLSIGSADLGNYPDFQDLYHFEKRIQNILGDQSAFVGYGGYAEIRPFYQTSAYEGIGNEGSRWRTVHLGLDFWSEAGTPVLAAFDGVIHSLQDNKGKDNYGPTIILSHQTKSGLEFFTLYGHLSRASLEDLRVGEEVKAGHAIAQFGQSHENGQWPPHLHFQIILDILDWKGDFPGVAFPGESGTWLSICPDPHAFLDLDTPKKEDPVKELLERRYQSLGKNLSISYEAPLYIRRGYRQFLYDHFGRRYLDTVNNVPHVGHQHPGVIRAATRQMNLLNTNTRYLHEQIVLLAEGLKGTLPPSLEVVYFVNSGSEANELALRLAETFTGEKDMLVVEVGYHGNTNGCIGVSSYKFDGKGGKGAPSTTHVLPIPDVYRGIYRDSESGRKYASHAESELEKIKQAGRRPAGFMAESILSCGGQIKLPENYLSQVYAKVREAGGLCIADEVQVGFGRVGSHFWGFELQGVVPDIVTMGKPFGNGFPLGAVVTTRTVAEAFYNGMEYFNTFGGNPVSCAIGLSVLEIIREENLQNHAWTTGKSLTNGLRELQGKYPIIGDVRGAGLFLGMELVKNPVTREPATREAKYLINRMRERAILMSADGPFNNVIKIKPPMCFDERDVSFLLENLEVVLKDSALRI